jgi:hypothetical protein
VRPGLAVLTAPTMVVKASISAVPEAPYASQMVTVPLRVAAAGVTAAVEPAVVGGAVTTGAGLGVALLEHAATRIVAATSEPTRVIVFIGIWFSSLLPDHVGCYGRRPAARKRIQ